jgi:flagellar L-ring protein precursor FlgH
MKRLAIAKLLCMLGLSASMQACWAVGLYDEDKFQPLTADRKGRVVGDLVTVMIYENASASTTADTTSGRNAGLSVAANSTARNLQAGVSTSNDFEGRGSTQRSGRVLGQLTVSIRLVMPNGDLLLSGIQDLEINGERQTIKLDGRVRPQDIAENNTVLSTRVAEARISFVGDGMLADHQKPSWWHKVLTWFGV